MTGFDDIDVVFDGTVRGESDFELDYTVHPDLAHIIRELDRLEEGPQFDVVAAFEAAIDAQFHRTREDMHILTGSLYQSGRVYTHYSPGLFVGTITFGGPSPGLIPNVKYGAAELSRGRTDGTVDPDLHHGPTTDRIPTEGNLHHRHRGDSSYLPDRALGGRHGRPDTHFFFAAVDDEHFGEHAYIDAMMSYLRGHE